MKKINFAISTCICFIAAIVMAVLLDTGSAYGFRDHHGGKGGRGSSYQNKSSGAYGIRNHHNNGGSHFSPGGSRYEPRHRPDYRPLIHHRPPAYNHRPPAYNHRPPVYHHRPPVYHHRPPVRYHRHHSPRFSVGLSANFFWPWYGYYSGWQSGSVFVSPTVGTVLLSLPLGCSSITVGSTVYYHNDGIYYKEIPSGYVVTEPPVQENIPVVTSPPSSSESDQVSVTTQVLNVRSGPGFHYPVIVQVGMGDSLIIRGETEGWLYVQTANGESGWVVSRFTTRWNGNG